jgi:hypothetical protein
VNGNTSTSNDDYVARIGTPTFAPGETTKTITIVVNGDGKQEANETFYLDLFGNSASVAEGVVRKASCPVLTVKGSTTGSDAVRRGKIRKLAIKPPLKIGMPRVAALVWAPML